MTEEEYILVTNVAHITDALASLRLVLGGYIVEKEKLQEIVAQLSKWQQKGYEKINR